MRKCKQDKPFPPQIAVGHGVSAGHGNPKQDRYIVIYPSSEPRSGMQSQGAPVKRLVLLLCNCSKMRPGPHLQWPRQPVIGEEGSRHWEH